MAILWLAVVPLCADTIVSTDTAPGGGVDGNIAGAEAWTQTTTYLDVTIMAEIDPDQTPGAIGHAYLMTQVGPGATVADQIAATTFTATGAKFTYTDDTLFTGLTLGPGTYYLVVARAFLTSFTGMGWEIAGASSPTLASGVNLLDYFNTYPSNTPASYAPANAFSHDIGGIYGDFSVTGSLPGATPEPSTVLLLGGAVALLVWFRHSRRRSGCG